MFFFADDGVNGRELWETDGTEAGAISCWRGGDGDDVLIGGPGNDSLDGGPGRDRCLDGRGDRRVDCERGHRSGPGYEGGYEGRHEG